MSMPLRADPDAPLPGSIRAVIPHPAGGQIVMTGFPGLDTGMDGAAVFMPDYCRETLSGLQAYGAESLVVLAERDELDTVFFGSLEAAAAEIGLALMFFPIVDYSVPSNEAAADWDMAAAQRAEAFASGATMAFCCQYGAGRSGLMASRCLIEAGMPPDAAIALVRSHFPEAVESELQEQWLRALA